MSEKKYFPLFVDFSEKRVLIIGAGNIASRRIQTMIDFTENLTVVATHTQEYVKTLEQEGKLTLLERAFSPEDLENADVVFAATNVPELNVEIQKQCKEKQILVNVCNDQALCDFFFPGIIKQDPFVVGITASGKDHTGVKRIKQKITETLIELKEQSGE